MVALIDTIFNPVLNWLNQILNMLQSVTIPSSYSIGFGNLFNPIAILSPSWRLVVTNMIVIFIAYCIINLVVNGRELFISFKNTVKWW